MQQRLWYLSKCTNRDAFISCTRAKSMYEIRQQTGCTICTLRIQLTDAAKVVVPEQMHRQRRLRQLYKGEI